MHDKVSATPEALELLTEIIADHGPVLFHQSGGCCDDGSGVEDHSAQAALNVRF